jgi:MbtH protein
MCALPKRSDDCPAAVRVDCTVRAVNPEEGYTMTSDDISNYKVVVNDEEQYSIWFVDRDPPLGWTEVGKEGPKEACLAYIEEVWTDMRPKSLRKRMDETG